MAPINNIVARSKDFLASRDIDIPESGTVIDLLIAFLGVFFVALLLTGLLTLLRRMKRRQMRRDGTLPQYSDIKHDDSQNQRRLTIQTADARSSIVVVNRQPMLADPQAPPHSPTNVPEIHITFPDEQDEFGHQKSGRVMVVRVGETTVGLEPMRDEQLPAYEKESSHSFYSIDMDQIGGLKEKDRSQLQ